MGGRHQRRSGLEGDAYKYNSAAELSWTVLRYTPSMVVSGEAIDQVLRMLKSRAEGAEMLSSNYIGVPFVPWWDERVTGSAPNCGICGALMVRAYGVPMFPGWLCLSCGNRYEDEPKEPKP